MGFGVNQAQIRVIVRQEALRLEMVAQGIVTADGTEQTLVEDILLSTLSGFIDLANMQLGDIVTIRQYVDMNGGFKLYAEETYNDSQSQPAVCITPKGSNTQMKVTLQQIGGAYREFGYEFLREV